VTKIIDGKAFAANLRAKVKDAATAFNAKTGRAPGLAVILVGEDPASQVYVRSKGKATVEAGMASFEHRLDAETATQDQLIALVQTLERRMKRSTVILVQLPLPKGMDDVRR